MLAVPEMEDHIEEPTWRVLEATGKEVPRQKRQGGQLIIETVMSYYPIELCQWYEVAQDGVRTNDPRSQDPSRITEEKERRDDPKDKETKPKHQKKRKRHTINQ